MRLSYASDEEPLVEVLCREGVGLNQAHLDSSTFSANFYKVYNHVISCISMYIIMLLGIISGKCRNSKLRYWCYQPLPYQLYRSRDDYELLCAAESLQQNISSSSREVSSSDLATLCRLVKLHLQDEDIAVQLLPALLHFFQNQAQTGTPHLQ